MRGHSNNEEMRAPQEWHNRQSTSYKEPQCSELKKNESPCFNINTSIGSLGYIAQTCITYGHHEFSKICTLLCNHHQDGIHHHRLLTSIARQCNPLYKLTINFPFLMGKWHHQMIQTVYKKYCLTLAVTSVLILHHNYEK